MSDVKPFWLYRWKIDPAYSRNFPWMKRVTQLGEVGERFRNGRIVWKWGGTVIVFTVPWYAW